MLGDGYLSWEADDALPDRRSIKGGTISLGGRDPQPSNISISHPLTIARQTDDAPGGRGTRYPGTLTCPPPTAARTPVVPGQDVGNPRATRTAR